MELLFKDEAIKQLKKINPIDKKKAKKKITNLLFNPLLGKPLKGKLTSLYSLKVWPLRIIYTFNPKKQIITIQTVEYRGSVYKN